MEHCPICNEYMWLSGVHKCDPRWVAVMIGDEQPDKPFAWSDYQAYTKIFADDAEAAAEDAASRFNSDTCEYPSHQVIGIMTYDAYCDWCYSDENTEDFADPAKLTWFDVACEMMPSYNARQRGRARVKED